MDAAHVVTCFLRNRGAVLLCLRADDAETYPGRWGTVTGYVEDGDPVGTARAEIEEETGLRADEVELVRAGDAFPVVDDDLGRRWRVHPFLFDAARRDVTLNEESAAADWRSPTAIRRRETVPALWRSYASVAPSAQSIAEDRDHGSAELSIRALEVLRDAAGVAATEEAGLDAVVETAEDLLDARSSMAALTNRVNRAMHGADSAAAVENAAEEGIDRAYTADAEAARRAAERLEGGSALTLSRSGTVLDALCQGAGAVYVAESRPAREGVGVAERLAEAGCDVTLCTDAAVAHVLSTRAVDVVLVGADAVLPDGRIVNKTGTRAAALAADREGLPCYAVAAADKVQVDDAVHLEDGPAKAVYDGPARVEAVNPTFDVTPADLLSGLVTERGVLDAAEIATVAAEHRRLAAWRDRHD